MNDPFAWGGYTDMINLYADKETLNEEYAAPAIVAGLLSDGRISELADGFGKTSPEEGNAMAREVKNLRDEVYVMTEVLTIELGVSMEFIKQRFPMAAYIYNIS